MLKHIISTYLCILLTIATAAQGLDGSPAGVMISHGHPKGGWMLSYTYMKNSFKDNLVGSTKVSDEKIFENYLMSPQTMTMDMHMLMGMYGAGARLSFMGMIAYSKMDMSMKMLPGVMHVHTGGTDMATVSDMDMSSSGMADAKLWALYKLSNGEGSSLVASLGVNLPFGTTSYWGSTTNMFAGQHLPYGMQLGTGSLDLMPGITYFKKSGKFSWSIQALGTFRPFTNMYDYRWGNDLTANLWGSYQFKKWFSCSLRSETFIASEIDGYDEYISPVMEPDADPKNYGGTRSSLYGGLNFYCNSGVMKDSKLGLEFGLPVYQYLNGPQLAGRSYVVIGITKSF